jgi:hypothetical protein
MTGMELLEICAVLWNGQKVGRGLKRLGFGAVVIEHGHAQKVLLGQVMALLKKAQHAARESGAARSARTCELSLPFPPSLSPKCVSRNPYASVRC